MNATVKSLQGVDGKTYFVVVVPSPVVAAGIIQGEYSTIEEAFAELANWN